MNRSKMNMNSALNLFNACLGLFVGALYFYQLIYAAAALIDLIKRKRAPRSRPREAALPHRYAVVIPARNEQDVIVPLIDSIRRQNYPTDHIDIFVAADNCTDATAQAARSVGAVVFERTNPLQTGKGYALDFALKKILSEYDRGYEAFAFFDADNLVHQSFFSEINRCFDAGARIITGYRNSKNFGSSWVASASSMWYLRESRFLSAARKLFGSSCLITGTGFVVARSIIEKNNGWKHHLLTEDIEFSVDSVISGEKIVFCEDAVIYDEQPVSFSQAWLQRLRWAKGFYQVFARYGKALALRLFRCPGEERLSCYDLLMTVSPAMLITLLGLTVNVLCLAAGLLSGNPSLAHTASSALITTVFNLYLMFFAYGALTLITERHMYRARLSRVVQGLFGFPLLMACHVPMAVQALICTVEWKPIRHTNTTTIADLPVFDQSPACNQPNERRVNHG